MSGFDDIVEMLIDCEAEIDVAAKVVLYIYAHSLFWTTILFR